MIILLIVTNLLTIVLFLSHGLYLEKMLADVIADLYDLADEIYKETKS